MERDGTRSFVKRWRRFWSVWVLARTRWPQMPVTARATSERMEPGTPPHRMSVQGMAMIRVVLYRTWWPLEEV
jgi:hypothetical protein